jgi:hypothetical protein
MIDVPAELVIALEEYMQALRACGHRGWAHRMERARVEIGAGNAHGLDIVLNAFGGTAGINDLPLPGDHRVKVLAAQVQDQASALRARIHGRP